MKRKILVYMMILLIILSSCGKVDNEMKAESPKSSIIPVSTENTANAEEIETRTLYVKKDLTTDYDIYLFAEHDGTIYTAFIQDGMSYVNTIYPEAKTIYEYKFELGLDFRDIDTCDDGIWILRNEDAIKVSYDGELLETVELDKYTAGLINTEYYYFEDLAVDADGYVYASFTMIDESRHEDAVAWVTTMAVISPEGDINYIIEDLCTRGLVKTSDGQVLIVDLYDLYTINRENGTIEFYTTIPHFGAQDGSGCVIDGILGGLTTLCDNSGIYSFDVDGNISDIIIWADEMLTEKTAVCVIPLDEGKFFCLNFTGSFILTPEVFVSGKKTLTLATFGWSNYSICVTEFNDMSDKYYIRTVDYQGERTYEDAVKLLNTQLITGDGPDIILFDNAFSQNSYAAKGWLYDLYEFMDDDDEISREDILFTDLMETNGGLYALSPNFFIETWYNLAPSLKGKIGWSYDDYINMSNSLKPGFGMSPFTEGSQFLAYALSGYIPGAVDWSTATCNFDSENFVDILNLSVSTTKETAALNETEMSNMQMDGKFMLNYASLYSPKNIAELETEYGGEVNLVGFPTPDGSCGSILCFAERFGISSQCKTPEGAWEFIKYVMTSKRATQDMQMFTAPTLKSALDEEIEGLLHPDEGEPTVTQAQAEKFYEILDSVTLVATGEPVIRGIITDEAQAFFAGDKTAEETAKLIQSRVHIYMSEQS